MSKTPSEDLAELVTEELVTYLGAGKLNQHQLATAINYSNLQIDSFDELKRLHFVLHDEVISFVEALPDRLRRVKSVNQRAQETTHGEVRGRINWQRTLQERPRRGIDPSIFVVDNPEIAYDIPENRIVKKLLAAIAEPLSTDLRKIGQDWQSKWDETDIVELQQILAHNVYLDALPSAKEISISKRDLETARRSRQPLYKEGESLYRLYRDLMNNRFERPRIQDFLKETIVTPMQTHRLFELFCLFSELHYQNSELSWRRIQSGMNEIAILERDTRRRKVYWDQRGPLKFFEEYPKPSELENRDVPRIFYRQAAALKDHSSILNSFLQRASQQNFYNGRPDFLILDYDLVEGEEKIREATLGEVKYTRSQRTFSQGLRELLEYVHFARKNREYLFGDDSVSVTGILCTDGVETEVARVEYIAHHTTEQLKNELSEPEVGD